jgi:hypothetical protein
MIRYEGGVFPGKRRSGGAKHRTPWIELRESNAGLLEQEIGGGATLELQESKSGHPGLSSIAVYFVLESSGFEYHVP